MGATRLRDAEQLNVFGIGQWPDRAELLTGEVSRNDAGDIDDRVGAGCAHEQAVSLL